MRTLYINDDLSEYVLHYTIDMANDLRIFNITKLAGYRTSNEKIFQVTRNHLIDLGYYVNPIKESK